MVFQKPFRELKTSAPLRGSDRRKLRDRVEAQYHALQPDRLVPEGIQSARFIASNGEHGILYTAGGQPLWFSLGRAGDPEAEDVLPTVYTLGKVPSFLPVIRTPDAVLPILMGGADLMVPGVHTPRDVLDPLSAGAIVSIRNTAVGRMVIRGSDIRPGRKGKAVRVLHVLGDALWEMGSKTDTAVVAEDDSEAPVEGGDALAQSVEAVSLADAAQEPSAQEQEERVLKPDEVDAFLRTALLHAIRSIPRNALPLSTSQFYSAHILPSRPLAATNAITPVDIKHSSFKSLTAFLKAAEKDGLLKLKGDSVTVLSTAHPEVAGLGKFRTVGEVDAKAKKRDADERAKEEQVKALEVVELWKPHGPSSGFFDDAGADTTATYTAVELRTVFNAYIVSKKLQNAHEPQYVDVPESSPLHSALDNKKEPVGEHCRRDEALRRLQDNMQSWHSIDGVVRKGALKPVNVTSKFRQGKRPVTLITNFEPYGLDADWLGEELRRICAGATSVNPLPGKSAGKEVLVQGKQIRAVQEFLLGRGVGKKWIETVDATEKK
ncbi:hypothetical protein EXIGLDRAFT_651009 [Exidia glandulosa HHB12029]|uniref:SUI1 domain-containing protein n=1 Tax=Exidia glandulosa HHB12029 TaxID=1314781 RepID=A0A165F7W3_EXIGL|nr:hypothetical protein EXIGLDRAFT_651009 [Exidia glandulosa HHB12029]